MAGPHYAIHNHKFMSATNYIDLQTELRWRIYQRAKGSKLVEITWRSARPQMMTAIRGAKNLHEKPTLLLMQHFQFCPCAIFLLSCQPKPDVLVMTYGSQHSDNRRAWFNARDRTPSLLLNVYRSFLWGKTRGKVTTNLDLMPGLKMHGAMTLLNHTHCGLHRATL
jgi:hypothetical protein